MKQIVLSIALAVAYLIPVTTNAQAKTDKQTFKINAEKSKVEWVGKKVTGQHNGEIKIAKGEITAANGLVNGGNVAIDMSTITCLDMQGEWAEKLVGHLKSDDFFSVEKHATSTFTIKNVSPIKGAKAGANNATIKGDLTIKGITHEIEFPAIVEIRGVNLVANGEAKIDRTKYDIKYGSANFFEGLGDKAIDNEFSVKFKLAATANK
jgi:polyisoprenoid-binding protein YceI